MAVSPVSLGPSLRAWSLAGLSHILCDGPVDPVFCGAEGSSARPVRPERPVLPPPAMPPRVPSSATARPVAGIPSEPAEANREPQAVSRTKASFAATDGVAADPAAWPAAWKNWFSRIAPAPVLWTYHELGADLTGIGHSPERSAFFKKLLGELGLPKGSSVFWPSAMPMAKEGEDAALRAEPAVFSAGLSRLNPQVVIVFGEMALEDMGLAGRIRPFRQEMVEGKLLLCLPEIDVLLHNQGQRASSVSLLRAVLASTNTMP